MMSNACTKVEQYFYESSLRKVNQIEPTGNSESAHSMDKMNKTMDFDMWTNRFGAIKQVYTTPSLLQMLSYSNLYFLANEGDAILQECSFFNPSDVTADVKQGTLIDCE